MRLITPRRAGARTWPQRLIIAVGAFVSGCLLIGATGLGWGFWQLSHIGRVNVHLPAAAAGAPQNYLVVGSDSRAGGDPVDPGARGQAASMGQRSDTIMVLRIDPRAEQATMLSLPRDLWVPIAGKGGGQSQRINTAYSLGKQTLVDTITQDFGIPINHYLEIDFRGFQGLVRAIGGVPMWFDRAYRDANSGLMVDHPGCTVLDGRNALAFARARHLEYLQDGHWRYDGTGDLGRISRQQTFIRRSIDRAVSKGLGDPLTLKRLVEVGARNLSVDKGLSVSDLLSLGRRFQKFNSTTLKTFTVPAAGFRTSAGASVLRLDDNGAQPLFNLFRDMPVDAKPEPSAVRVTVLNSSGRIGEAANVAGALLRTGFGIDRWGNGSDLGHTSEARPWCATRPAANRPPICWSATSPLARTWCRTRRCGRGRWRCSSVATSPPCRPRPERPATALPRPPRRPPAAARPRRAPRPPRRRPLRSSVACPATPRPARSAGEPVRTGAPVLDAIAAPGGTRLRRVREWWRCSPFSTHSRPWRDAMASSSRDRTAIGDSRAALPKALDARS